jgi:hypothetical protein
MRKQEQPLKDALRSLDHKPVKAIRIRNHLVSAFERRMKEAKKIFR